MHAINRQEKMAATPRLRCSHFRFPDPVAAPRNLRDRFAENKAAGAKERGSGHRGPIFPPLSPRSLTENGCPLLASERLGQVLANSPIHGVYKILDICRAVRPLPTIASLFILVTSFLLSLSPLMRLYKSACNLEK